MTGAKEKNIKDILGTDTASQEVAEKAVAETKKDLDEEMRLRKIKLIKIGSALMFVAIMMIIMTIAWFTNNKENSASGMGVKVKADGFELRVEDGNIGYSDLYGHLSLTTNNSLTTGINSGDTIQWRISGNSDTIKPGTQGVLEFTIITSGMDASSLHYDLDIQCYTAATSGTGENITVTGLNEITTNTVSQDDKDGANYLKSHLMFFKGRTGTSEANYQYNGFIANINDFTLTPTATATANEYTATIYWIWPNTIGQIMLDSSQTADKSYLGNDVVSLLNSTGETNDRSAITSYLNTNISTIFKGTDSYSSLITSLYTKRTATTDYHDEYNALSSGYNAADLMIGKNVDYISVLLQASANG